MPADGVTTVEIKSGYGLTLEDELKMLRVARALGARSGVRVRTSLLAAHAVPPEFAGRPDDYVSLIVDEILPAAVAEGLVDAVDGFAEAIAFSPAQIGRVFEAARKLGVPVKLHADQLTDGGGAALAFAVALLASGLSSSSVGTYAGQVVMAGFIGRRIPVFARRALTMLPALVVLGLGLSPTGSLVISQVVLSFGIPFALVPLVLLTRRADVMGALVNRPVTTVAAGATAGLIIVMNVYLLYVTFR